MIQNEVAKLIAENPDIIEDFDEYEGFDDTDEFSSTDIIGYAESLVSYIRAKLCEPY